MSYAYSMEVNQAESTPMTNPDYRALCAELLAAIQFYTKLNPAAIDMSAFELTEKLMDAMAATVAALAEPVTEGPSELELETIELALWDKYRTKGWGGEEFMYDNNFSYALEEYRAVLARWGRPTPVPVSEGPPGPGEWVWHCYAGVRFWQHGRYNGRQFFIGDGPESQPATHWLPAHALPFYKGVIE
jgi:hypothetical protein